MPRFHILRPRLIVPVLIALVAFSRMIVQAEVDDEFLWLEEIDGPKALQWVRGQNEATLKLFEADPRYGEFKETSLRLLQDKERIPAGSLRDGYVYNFWQDDRYVRGVWRRATLADYRKPDVPWEILLDIDQLAEKEGENWVYKGIVPLPPDFARCLVRLSRGGKDAQVLREFDVQKKAFVPGGFRLEEAKSRAAWRDRDTLIVGTDFGEGSLTTSGYPRVLKIWHRGQSLADAKTLFEGRRDDVSVWFSRDFSSKRQVGLIARGVTFYESDYWLTEDLDTTVKVPVPRDAEFEGFFQGRLLFLLRSDWQTAVPAIPLEKIPRGSLVALSSAGILSADNKRPAVDVVYLGGSRHSIVSVAQSETAVLVQLLDNVKSRVLRLTPPESSSRPIWQFKPITMPDNGTVRITSTNPFTDKALLSYQGFLDPERLYLLNDPAAEPELLKARKPKFDAAGLSVRRHEATSKDGTKVPYFLVGSENLTLDGSNPTILYAYGGFEIPMLPRYSPVTGKLWLEHGGVYVLANIRGGGEFGPAWHQAALKENRQRAYDDFLAVAEDLIRRKITAPDRLGIMGGSNGGLLMGAALVQRPDLFKAIVCQVPLLDMLRYTKLLAGASWIAEYGDPEEEKIRRFWLHRSPYHNIKPGVRYPEVFFLTSTKDDRVHPGHARKMVARMLASGHKVFYFENVEGGHGAAANLQQRARRYALEYVYFHRKLLPADATAEQATVEMPSDVLSDKIRGGLLGQLLGNLNGLEHEMKYIDSPGSVEQYTPALPEGARTDDDTDLEWVYVVAMQHDGTLLLPPERITGLWKSHINERIWCANRYARRLMDLGLDPPLTGLPALNPWSDFNLSGQFVCESFGLIAPGMPQTAARVGLNYTHVTIGGEPAQTTQLFTAMIATAFLTDRIEAILDAGVASTDPDSEIRRIVADVRRWHRENPDDPIATRQKVHDAYTRFGGAMRDRNGYELNTASTVAALLYGQGDVVETLRTAFNFGWDADNNAATAGTILGVIRGEKWMKEQGWNIRDTYRNTSRPGMPEDETITRFGDRLVELARRAILEYGGEKKTASARTVYRIRTQKPANVEPLLDPTDGQFTWKSVIKRHIDAGLSEGATELDRTRAAYLAICLDVAGSLRQERSKPWAKAVAALNQSPQLLDVLIKSPTPAAERLRKKATAAGVKLSE